MAQDLCNTNVGPYRVERLLGRGGMGAVYEAADRTTGRRVAVKFMNASEAGAPEESIARFEREARVAAEIRHPNVAQVLGGGREGDLRYLVMEYIDGEPLGQTLKQRGHVSGRRAVDYIRQAALGLHAAFERGVIHRDVKPENLMLAKDDTVKIVDFGLAKTDHADSFQTASGAVMGTPHYMAPEQAMGKPVDHRTDIYSLGATFYHLLTGRPPFMSENVFTILEKHIKEEPVALTRWNPNIPEAVCKIVYRMMAKHPDDRYQTYGHLIQTLEDVQKGRGHSMTMEVVDDRRIDADAEPEGDRRRLIFAVGACALFLLAALGVAIKNWGKPLPEPDPIEAADPFDRSRGNMPSPKQWKSTVMPVFEDLRKSTREQEDEAKGFESRRERMNR